MIRALGRRALDFGAVTGRSTLFLGWTALSCFRPPLRLTEVVSHTEFIGNRSLGIVVLTSVFTGMVLVLQGYNALIDFGSTAQLGPLVALSLLRELGPVLCALMITARAGSAIAATVAGMRVTEQIDALEALAIDPIHYLASTRLMASVIAVPLMTALFNVIGIGAAYSYARSVLGVDPGSFMASIRDSVDGGDVAISLGKALIFGIFIAWIACFNGYYAKRGASGIGQATTQAVVQTAVMILAADYVLTAFFL